MTIRKKHVYNMLFFGFILFLLTPYGLGTRAKLTQGVIFLKGMVWSPSAIKTSERVLLSSINTSFKSISNGQDTNLGALKGKVVFINHWATWCPPCRAEMPSLDKLYRDYADKVAFIFLTTDPKKAVDTYYSANDFEFPTYSIASAIPPEINTTSIPATFILDRDGKLVLKEYGPADWNSKNVRNMLDALLAN